jgi:hypothetical protein
MNKNTILTTKIIVGTILLREELVKFGRWMVIHTDEVQNTIVPCRRYKNKVFTVEELCTFYLEHIKS